jgi:putative ABC transport system substrate-binding protein
MKRRKLTMMLAALTLPQTTAAQPVGKVWRIGWLGEGAAPVPGAPRPAIDLFVEALRERGYSVGQNLTIEYRFAGGMERLPILAAELVVTLPPAFNPG